MRRIAYLGMMAAFLLALSACATGLPSIEPTILAPTQGSDKQATAVVLTVAIRQTISMLETQIAAGTATPTPNPNPVTSTPRPPTATPQPTATVRFISSTPLPTLISQVPCNAAAFITDVTIPDNTAVAPEQSFIKTWRIKNVGSCAWNPSYNLVFASGDQMGGPASVKFPVGIKPNETVDLSVTLFAPKEQGKYTGYWQISSPEGDTFGTGMKNQPFYVKISVGDTTLTHTKFIETFCSAVWKNEAGDSLPCPASKTDFTTGAILRIDNPKLEGGYQDDEPALIMIPNEGSGGLITGRFPPFKVLSGDHFIAVTGCMDASPKCTVSFNLGYTLDGTTVTSMQAWNESSDDNWTKIDIDLSSLANKDVQFIFTVGNKDGSSADDQVFWLDPYIKR